MLVYQGVLSQDVTIKPPSMCGKASETLRRISQEIRPDDINKARAQRARPVFFAGKRGIEAINLAMFTVENHGKISGESPKHMEFLSFFNGNIIGEDRTNDDIP